MSNPYRFSGITDFVVAEGLSPSAAAKISGLFFVARVSDALSQIPTTHPSNRASMFAVADDAIIALKAAVATVEAAYAHVLEACPIPVEPSPEPENPVEVKAAAEPVKSNPTPKSKGE